MLAEQVKDELYEQIEIWCADDKRVKQAVSEMAQGWMTLVDAVDIMQEEVSGCEAQIEELMTQLFNLTK